MGLSTALREEYTSWVTSTRGGIMRFKEIVDLGRELFPEMPNIGGLEVAFWPIETFNDLRTLSQGKFACESKMMLMPEHCGTHVDAPRHFVEEGAPVDKVPLSQFILPGHLLDFTAKGPREAITVSDLEAAELRTGRSIGPGTATIVWTGTDKDWGKPGWVSERPYLPVESAQWLAERRITLFATDLIGMDNPDEWWWPSHKVWLSQGICMVQQLCNLDKLAGKEFLFIALPLKMRGGTGSPVRPVALVM